MNPFKALEIYREIKKYEAKIREFPDDIQLYTHFLKFCQDNKGYKRAQKFINQNKEKIASFHNAELSDLVTNIEIQNLK